MKKNTTLKNTLSGISKIGRMMPRSINESMDFTGLEDEDMNESADIDDMSGEESEPMPEENAAPEMEEQPAEGQAQGQGQMVNSAHAGVQSVPEGMRKKVAGFVDNIRKKSLLAMAELADYPNSLEYEQMKKLWQMCDKKPEQKQGNTL